MDDDGENSMVPIKKKKKKMIQAPDMMKFDPVQKQKDELDKIQKSIQQKKLKLEKLESEGIEVNHHHFSTTF